MQNTILLGNGINLCYPESYSWDDLLKELRGTSHEYPHEDIPQPIDFERICVQRSYESDVDFESDIYRRTKKQICTALSKDDPHAGNLHLQVTKLPVDNIVTTNYDLSIEKAMGINDGMTDASNSAKYLLSKTNRGSSRPFVYHAHGIITRSKSICIGYDHYVGYISRMRKEFFRTSNNGYPQIVAKMLNDTHNELLTWPELFFLSDIYIVGLGLNFCEIDLWWLLVIRASLLNQFPEIEKKNCVVFYDCKTEERIDESLLAKYELMKDLGIETVGISGDDYPTAYHRALEDVEKRIALRRIDS